jgi:hypothetical protein
VDSKDVKEDLARLAELAKKHPWYDPGATMNENLIKCRHFRGTKVQRGFGFDPGQIQEALKEQ